MFVVAFVYSRDELLVGAPMFRADGTSPETGRVFIYVNVGVSQPATIQHTRPTDPRLA